MAIWVSSNYLRMHLDEKFCPIRNAEGFLNLDKAYRRARQLTGKAQDKWPFLNKFGRNLSSTVIKRAILGEVTVGTPQPETNGAVRDTPMTNGSDSRPGRISSHHLRNTSADTVQSTNYRQQSRDLP